MPKGESLNVVGAEPDVQPAYEELDYTAFLKWDDWSEKIASSGQMSPPWFRQVGLDDGEILLFSPISEHVPDDEDNDQWAASRWNHPGAQIAEVCGPTKRAIGSVLNAKDSASKDRASLLLVAQCLTNIPETVTAKRDFTVAGKVVLKKGEHMPAPGDFHDWPLPDGLKADDVISAYIGDFLPDRLRKQTHTAALCMAVPEIEFVIVKGGEKNEDKEARMRPDIRRQARDDDNFIEGSSGS